MKLRDIQVMETIKEGRTIYKKQHSHKQYGQ